MPDYVVKWLKGLLSALIGGAANGLAAILVDPVNFNFETGKSKLGLMTIAGAIIAVLNFLKQSPLPCKDDNEK